MTGHQAQEIIFLHLSYQNSTKKFQGQFKKIIMMIHLKILTISSYKYHTRLQKPEVPLQARNLKTIQTTAKSCTFFKSWMIQLSKCVFGSSVAAQNQKISAHMCNKVESLPHGFDEFENAHGPIIFDWMMQQKSHRHFWKAEAFRNQNCVPLLSSLRRRNVVKV